MIQKEVRRRARQRQVGGSGDDQRGPGPKRSRSTTGGACRGEGPETWSSRRWQGGEQYRVGFTGSVSRIVLRRVAAARVCHREGSTSEEGGSAFVQRRSVLWSRAEEKARASRAERRGTGEVAVSRARRRSAPAETARRWWFRGGMAWLRGGCPVLVRRRRR